MPAEPNSRRVTTQSCAAGSDFLGVGDAEKLHDGDTEYCSDVELAVLQEINALQSEMDATKREIMEKEATLLRWQGTVPGMQHVDRIRPGRVARAPPTLEESALGAIIEDCVEEGEASIDSVEAKVTASTEPDKALAKVSEEEETAQNKAENELSEADNKPLEAALAISLKEKVQDAIDKVRSHLAQFNKETAEMTLPSPTFSTGSGASKATDLGTPSSSVASGPTTLLMARPGTSVRMSSAGICYTTTRAAPAVVCDAQDWTGSSQPQLVPQPSASCRSSSVTLMGSSVQRQSSSPAHPTVLMRDGSLRRSHSKQELFRQRSARDQVGCYSQTPGPQMRPTETPRTSPRAIIVPARGAPARRERSAQHPRLGQPAAETAGARAAQMSVRRLRVEPSRPEVSSVASSKPLSASYVAPPAPPRSVQVVPGLVHQQRSSIAAAPGHACTVRRLTSPRPVERIEVTDHRAPLRTFSVVGSAQAPIVA